MVNFDSDGYASETRGDAKGCAAPGKRIQDNIAFIREKPYKEIWQLFRESGTVAGIMGYGRAVQHVAGVNGFFSLPSRYPPADLWVGV